jgi:hypothetical protein
MSQTKPLPSVPPPTRQVRWQVFSAGFPRGDSRSAEFTRRSGWQNQGRGRGDLRFDIAH